MNLPYYFSDTSNSSQPKSNLFQKAKEKLSGINSSYQTPPTTLLNEYLNLSIHNYNQKTTDIPKITINSCLNYPSSREYQSKYLEIPNSITQCFDGFVKKSDQINRQDIQSDIIMNRMQLNEFLYQPNSHSKNISQSDYSNVKEYKFSSMVVNRNKSPFFSPIDKSGEVSEFFQKEESRIENKIFLEKSGPIVEKTTKNARFDLKSFSPPKKYNCENNSFIEEFPLDELGRSLSSSKKKKKIFDTANITQLNDKTKNIHHFFPDKIKEFLLRANDKNLRVFFPNNEDFLKKYKILDKDGENKSKIYLKHAFLEESAILFENFEVKIGLKSSLTQTEPNRDNGLLIFLYYCNKNKGDLKNCLLKFSASKTLKKVKIFPSIYDFTIEGNSTKRQDFYLENYSPDDEIITLSLEYKNDAYSSHKIMQKIEFPLPITINKFMEFKPIDTTTFQKQWRSLKINCLMSEPLPLDRHILMITDDLIRYFPFITDISPKILNRSFDFIEKNNKNSKGNFKKTNSKKTFKANQRKWGGMFTINGLKDFLIRIRIIEDYYICFEVGDRDQNDEFSKKIIETLCFIFCQN